MMVYCIQFNSQLLMKYTVSEKRSYLPFKMIITHYILFAYLCHISSLFNPWGNSCIRKIFWNFYNLLCLFSFSRRWPIFSVGFFFLLFFLFFIRERYTYLYKFGLLVYVTGNFVFLEGKKKGNFMTQYYFHCYVCWFLRTSLLRVSGWKCPAWRVSSWCSCD